MVNRSHVSQFTIAQLSALVSRIVPAQRMVGIFTVFALLLMAFLSFGSAPTLATDGELDAPIEIEQNSSSDTAIKERITSIFEQIESLQNVVVEVQHGVVELSGVAANESQAGTAMALATRIEGVVTVEDNIERSLALGDNVKPVIGDVKSTLDTFFRAAPLALVALGFFSAILFLGYCLAKWQWLWRKIMPNAFLAELVSQAVLVLSLLLALVVSLSVMGAKALLGTILGGAGVLGLAVGFAVRDTLENYISSIMLSLRQPFRAQDRVVIDAHEGVVVRLTSRATILMTLDGNHLRIPNAQVFKAVILNYTRNPERRFSFELGIDANDDPLSAIEACQTVVSTLDFILDEPKPEAIIASVGDSNIVILVHAWVDQTVSDYGKARSLAIRAAKDTLEARGFTLPEPIYRLRFDSSDLTSAIVQTHETPAKNSETAAQTESGAVASTYDKQAIKGRPADVNLDVAPSEHIEKRVSEERSQQGEKDLLDSNRPVE